MNISKTFKVCPGSFRKIDDPFENAKSTKYVFYVHIDDVPEGIPMATNPRDQDLNSSVAKSISDSLLSNDGYFHLKNRGIVLSAHSVSYNNRTDDVTINFSDSECHGNVDGGHTYKIVCDHKGEDIDQYVAFEVFVGVEDIISFLADARNNSVQVDEKSLAELRNHFEPIKEALEGMPFFNRIAFRQNQKAQDEETGKNLRMIDAREIVAIVSMFNIDKYTEDNHPIQAYSSKAKMLDFYLENPNFYRRFVNIMTDIFDLFDAVECDFAIAYNEAGGRYGRKKYSGYKDGKVIAKSKYLQNDLQYKVPDGFVYPIVAAFRSLIRYNQNTEKYEWINSVDPLTIWNDCKKSVATKIMNYANDIGDNPNAVGKASNTWDIAYMTIGRLLGEY